MQIKHLTKFNTFLVKIQQTENRRELPQLDK